MTEFKAYFKSVQSDLGGSLPGKLVFGLPGEDGGYYLVGADQVDAETVRLTFTPSKEDMPAVEPMEIKLPRISAEQIAKAVEEYFAENPPTGGTVTDEQIAEAVDKYLDENPISEADPTVPSWAKQPQKPAYTAQEVGALPDTYVPPDQTAAQVGADPAGTAAAMVGAHNTSDDSHNDLRLELKAISDRLNAFFDSDDKTLDELSEIVAYITGNKGLIDSITTSKVSVTDIIDNLTTNVKNKPLSAAQGVVLKGLIDSVTSSLSGKLDAAKLPEAIDTALAQAKESGEFDGEKGDPGVTPHIGTNGNWYIGSADTGVKAQGKDGAEGRGIKSIARTSGNGAAGTTDTYTITYTDNTTSTLTVYNGKNGTNGTSVTVKSVSESTADGGSNVVTFSDGKTLNVKNGSKGSKGDKGDSIKGDPGADGVSVSSVKQTTTSSADGGSNVVTVTLSNGTTSTFTVKNGSKGSTGAAGKTPVKGTDYWTETDKTEIVNEVLAALPTWTGGNY